MGEESVRVEDLGTARAFGAAAEGVEELLVGADGRRRLGELAVDETAADEHLARDDGIDAAVVAATGGDDDESIERDLLGGADEARARVPFRRMVAVLADRPCDGFQPADVDHRGVAGEEAGGVDELAGDDPGGECALCLVLLELFCED